MTNRLLLALACVLFVVRLPSLAQPMGADQGLYAYVGEAHPLRRSAVSRRLGSEAAGDSRDVRGDADDPAAQRGGAGRGSAHRRSRRRAAVALGATSMAGARVGAWAAVVFLLLSNPAFARLGGVSVRAQCETFIALAVTGAFLCLSRRPRQPRRSQGRCRGRSCSASHSSSSTTQSRTSSPVSSRSSPGDA